MTVRTFAIATLGAALALQPLSSRAAAGAHAQAHPPAHAEWTPGPELGFDVYLGDKVIGHQRFTFVRSGDTLRVETRAEFVVKVLGVKVYAYDHRNTESWRGNCLQSIDSRTDSNGKHYRVRGRADATGFAVDATGSDRRLGDCVGTFAYWDRNRLLSRANLLNPQTGDYLPVRVRSLGPGTLDGGARRIGVERWALLGKDLDITLEYAAAGGEWLGLESRLEGGRVLRYRRTLPALAAATTAPAASGPVSPSD